MLHITNSKRLITTILFLFFASNIFYRTIINQRDLLIDLSGSIIIIVIYLKFYKKWNQDALSYSILAFALAMHNIYLYGTTIFGIRFDHYMHVLGGISIALVLDRIFKYKLTKVERFYLAIISASGIGAIGEIIEWLGYNFLGNGDGFFLYGKGDEGEWQNASLDMIYNFLGGLFLAISILLFGKNKTALNKTKELNTNNKD